MKYFILFLSTLLFTTSCNLFTHKNNPKTNIDAKFKILETDKAFSKMSVEKGMKAAFLEYIDSNGVLLRKNSLPLLGADAIDYIIQQNDTEFKLEWEPKSCTVAQSGELAYTYGIYAMTPTDKDTVLYGTYISIWKKQLDGNWKIVLDSGNDGISP